MNLDSVIKDFSSRCIRRWEPNGNFENTVNTNSSLSYHSSQQIKDDDASLVQCLERCCKGTRITALMVQQHLLSEEDLEDFSDGLLTEEGLKSAIRYWDSIGAPYHYVSK